MQARTLFNLARVAVEAVEKLIEEKRNQELREAGRREQLALDEAGRRRMG